MKHGEKKRWKTKKKLRGTEDTVDGLINWSPKGETEGQKQYLKR